MGTRMTGEHFFKIDNMKVSVDPFVWKTAHFLDFFVEMLPAALKFVYRWRRSFYRRVFTKKIQLNFTSTCIHCKQSFTTTPKEQAVRICDGQASCQHCGKAQLWTPEILVEEFGIQVDAFLETLPDMEDWNLSQRDAYLLATVAVLLKPLVLVRLVEMRTEKIGHLILNTWNYCLKKKLGMLPVALDYLYFDVVNGKGFVSNAYMTELWGRMLRVRPKVRDAALPLKNTDHVLSIWHWDKFDLLNQYAETHLLSLPFTSEEHSYAQQELQRMGVAPGAKIVCLHVRDMAYGAETYGPEHAYESFRNADIDNYRQAMEWLAEQGWYVLRMGAVVAKPLAWENDRIIDYATRYRTEFMDIWLSANCDLMISTGSGIDIIPSLVGNNVLVSDAELTIMLPGFRNVSYLFKDYCNADTLEPYHLKEIFANKMAFAWNVPYFLEKKVKLQHVKPEVILGAVIEKFEMMLETTRDEHLSYLQACFFKAYRKYTEKALAEPYQPEICLSSMEPYPPYASISGVYLKKYRNDILGV